MKKFRLSLQSKFLLSIAVIIIPIATAICIWAGIQNERQAMSQVVNQARILTRQIILTRQWVSDCGGVMVKRNSQGAQNTNFFYDDQLQTPRGTYQRFTPSMVTKKLSQYSHLQDMYRFNLVSANPLNPENQADAFEKTALGQFKNEGLTETSRIEPVNDRVYFQYMVPLFMDQACLSCHQRHDLSKGAVAGGLSVFLPIDEMESNLRKGYLRLMAAGAGLLLLTVFTLFFLLRRVVVKPLKMLQEATNQISAGHLEARVNIATGDEFEKVGYAFNEMAAGLFQNRDHLQRQITQATRELAGANRELQTLDTLKSDFIATMSHELRTPLTVIRGGIDYLNRTIRRPDNRDYLSIIDKNLDRLIRLVSDLFDFTKIEAKTIEWSFAQENLAGLIQEVIEITSPLSLAKRIAVNFDYPGDIPVQMDLERMEQVLVNLLDNAVKFSDADTQVDIALEHDPDWATVAVRDRGVGISREKLGVIFEKFYSLPSGSKGSSQGTGLGLAICKAIIQAHGGSIWAESTLGRGSTFFFRLPRCQK